MGSPVPTQLAVIESGLKIFLNVIFNEAGQPDGGDTDALFSLLYDELHRMARRELARKVAPANLSVTTLLHEAYIDMSGRAGPAFPDQARFMGYAARVMRGLIIDHARKGTAMKRGGEFEITSLVTEGVETPADAKELSAISDALDQLAKVEPELAERACRGGIARASQPGAIRSRPGALPGAGSRRGLSQRQR
jgi:RNA polymerase sigma factor (TIGR02999 family)